MHEPLSSSLTLIASRKHSTKGRITLSAPFTGQG
jgi:hypothetical protein